VRIIRPTWSSPSLVFLPPYSFSRPSVIPIPFFFSRLFLVYLSSMCPEGSSQMHVPLLHLTLYKLYGQSKAICFFYVSFSRFLFYSL
jgi:hypothetical protein